MFVTVINRGQSWVAVETDNRRGFPLAPTAVRDTKGESVSPLVKLPYVVSPLGIQGSDRLFGTGLVRLSPGESTTWERDLAKWFPL